MYVYIHVSIYLVYVHMQISLKVGEGIDMTEAHTFKLSHTWLAEIYKCHPSCSYHCIAPAASAPGKQVLALSLFTCIFRSVGSDLHCKPSFLRSPRQVFNFLYFQLLIYYNNGITTSKLLTCQGCYLFIKMCSSLKCHSVSRILWD